MITQVLFPSAAREKAKQAAYEKAQTKAHEARDYFHASAARLDTRLAELEKDLRKATSSKRPR